MQGSARALLCGNNAGSAGYRDGLRFIGVMTTVAHCTVIDHALLVKSLLEGCGIKAYVPDELTAQTAPPYLFASSSQIRVQVADADAETARAILTENGHREEP